MDRRHLCPFMRVVKLNFFPSIILSVILNALPFDKNIVSPIVILLIALWQYIKVTSTIEQHVRYLCRISHVLPIKDHEQ